MCGDSGSAEDAVFDHSGILPLGVLLQISLGRSRPAHIRSELRLNGYTVFYFTSRSL